MKKHLLLIPLALLGLTSCNPIAQLKCLVEDSTDAIHCNAWAVETSTESINRNACVINASTEAIKENLKHLESANE